MNVDASRIGVETYDSLKFVQFQDELGTFYLQEIDGTLLEPYLETVGKQDETVYGVVVGENIKRTITDDGIGEPLRNTA